MGRGSKIQLSYYISVILCDNFKIVLFSGTSLSIGIKDHFPQGIALKQVQLITF